MLGDIAYEGGTLVIYTQNEQLGSTRLKPHEIQALTLGIENLYDPHQERDQSFWEKTLLVAYSCLSSFQRPEPGPDMPSYQPWMGLQGRQMSDEEYASHVRLKSIVGALEAEGSHRLTILAENYFNSFRVGNGSTGRLDVDKARRRIEELWADSWGINVPDRPQQEDLDYVSKWATKYARREDLLPMVAR